MTYREITQKIELNEKIAAKGIEMRQYQKAYFKTRKKSALFAAKKAEKEFDELLNKLNM